MSQDDSDRLPEACLELLTWLVQHSIDEFGALVIDLPDEFRDGVALTILDVRGLVEFAVYNDDLPPDRQNWGPYTSGGTWPWDYMIARLDVDQGKWEPPLWMRLTGPGVAVLARRKLQESDRLDSPIADGAINDRQAETTSEQLTALSRESSGQPTVSSQTNPMGTGDSGSTPQGLHLVDLLIVLLDDYRMQDAELREEIARARGIEPDPECPPAKVVGEGPITDSVGMKVYERRTKLPGVYDGTQETSPWFYAAQWVCQRAGTRMTCEGLGAHLLSVKMHWATDTTDLTLELSRINDKWGTTSLLAGLWDRHTVAMERMKEELELPKPTTEPVSTSNRAQTQPTKKAKRKRTRAPKPAQKDFQQAREDAVADAIRRLVKKGENVTAQAVEQACTGPDGRSIPEGTIRGTKAWKGREKIMAEESGVYENIDYWSSEEHELVDGSARTPLDELIDREGES